MLKANFTSSDGAFTISCTKQIKSGVELATECIVTVDSKKSVAGTTAITTGAVANVTLVKFLSETDVNALTRSVTQVAGYFQSTEKIPVVLPNGNKVDAPKIRIECELAASADCHATVF